MYQFTREVMYFLYNSFKNQNIVGPFNIQKQNKQLVCEMVIVLVWDNNVQKSILITYHGHQVKQKTLHPFNVDQFQEVFES